MADDQPTPEEWRPVVGYEGIYEIMIDGRVRALDRVITDSVGHTYLRRGGEKVVRVGDSGYCCVTLSQGGRNRTVKVHRLIFEAFVGPIPEGAIVRHLNDVKTDNRLENLALGTHADNRHDSVRNGTHHQANLTRCPGGHLYDEANTRYMQPGNRRYCGECHRLRGKAWKDANREKVRAANREYMRTYNKRVRG
ncbi:NUMOD4 motif-containing HNH endonuclease [Dietzia cercidiphylli]|uniref:HNH endonuclease n=1 Tax=Dietzia cercidiphylli TaxID=498199 RepID=A0ABN2J9E7_9ACTN|nr:NUMOD4 motif-containing HNH endonuclease [Dietzia cercidiphylli]MBB1046469.1 hypothetical protein [Dietzia cercidiphylli]